MFSRGTGREDPFHSGATSPGTADKDQMADCHPWGQFPITLGSVSDLPTILSHSLKSHTFPIHFLILFLSYCHIDKDILPSLFLFFFSPIFLVPIYHRWKRNTRQGDTAKLNLLSSPSKGRLHIQGSHMRIKGDLHRAQWAGTASPAGTWNCSAQSVSVLGNGSTSVPAGDGSTWSNLPWDVGCFQSNAPC